MTVMEAGPAMETSLCGGRTRNHGHCRKSAGWGTNHPGVGRCSLHGGATPSHEVSGQVTLARREYFAMGRPLDVEPHEAILECIRIAAGEVQYASERISELEHNELVGAVVTSRPLKEEKGAEDPSVYVQEFGQPAVHIWVKVRHEAMDRLVAYSKAALAAGIAERQVRIAEQQGQLLAQVIRGILTELGVMDRPEAPAVVRKHLALVSGRAA